MEEIQSIYSKMILSFFTGFSDVFQHYNWVVHTYCLMGFHYDFLVKTPNANLSKGRASAKQFFTQ
jgi:putative transposase